MPRAIIVAAQGLSLTAAPCLGLTAHSVHRSGRSGRPARSVFGRKSIGATPYEWVEMKSSGRSSSAHAARKSSIQPAAAVAGPPTRNAGSTAFTARAAAPYSAT